MAIEWTLSNRRRTIPSYEDIKESFLYRLRDMTCRNGTLDEFNLFIERMEAANKAAMEDFRQDCITWLRSTKDKAVIQEEPKKPDAEPDGYSYPPFQELRPPDDEPPVIRESSSERARRQRRERERVIARDLLNPPNDFVGLAASFRDTPAIPTIRTPRHTAPRYLITTENRSGNLGANLWLVEERHDHDGLNITHVPLHPVNSILEYTRDDMVTFEAVLNRALGSHEIQISAMSHRTILDALVFVRNYLNNTSPVAPF